MKELKITMKADAAEVLLYDVIGEDPWFGGGISAKTFREQIRGLKGTPINLRINSPGGSVTEGAAMLVALDEHKAGVTVSIDGLAASAASVVAMGGKTVKMASNALFMIHNPMAGVLGGAADMRHTADILDKVKGQLIDAYARRSDLSRDKLSAAMDAETWYTAAEALDAGFVDEEVGAMNVAACAGLDKFKYRNMPKPIGPTPEQLAEHEKRRAALARLQSAAAA